jgi:LSD1 subclass zinc finger protein
MVKKDLVCTSCKSKLIGTSGSVNFECPSCSKEEIVRCPSCRNDSIKYTCKNCSFVGPN